MSTPAASPVRRMIDRASPDPATLDATMAAAIADIVKDNVGGLTKYAGGKNGAGIYQRLINSMPPHRVYIEAFLGSGAVMRRKRAAAVNVGIDVDPEVIGSWNVGGRHGDRFRFICTDAIKWLSEINWTGEELIYCDPPYLGTARARPDKTVYRHEMMGRAEHVRLLQLLTSIPAMVIVSGYASKLYDGALAGWRREEYQAMTRGGLKPEVMWMNYPAPTALHDYSYLGRDFHDRCRIARKISRWTRKLASMPALERMAILAAFDVARGKSS